MKKSLFIIMLFCITNSFEAKPINDTLKRWTSKFYKLDNLESSGDGKWIAVKKWYGYNIDTTMIFNTQKPNTLIGTVIRMKLGLTFLKDDAFIASDIDKAEFWNLKSGLKFQYDNVKKASALVDKNRYCILNKNGTLTVYNNDTTILHQIEGVQKTQVTDGKEKLFAVSGHQNLFEIQDLSNKKIRKLYRTENAINTVELSQSGKYLMVTESEPASQIQSLTMINIAEGKSLQLNNISAEKSDQIRFTEIQSGKAFLIASTHLIKPDPDQLIDIWYGNDSDLKAKKYGSAQHRFWLWTPETGQVIKIPNNKFSTIASLNNDRYLLAFNPTENHNYITWRPQLRMHIYDTYQDSFRELTALKGVAMESPEIISSPNGRYFLASEDGERWSIFEIGGPDKDLIKRSGLRYPKFSQDGESVIFDSTDDLWVYNIKNKNLTRLIVGKGKKVDVLNAETTKNNFGFNFSVSMVDFQKPVFFRIWDKDSNSTSYALWHHGHVNTVIAGTPNNIKNIVHDDQLEKFCTLEENYNMPPKLLMTEKRKGKRTVLFSDDSADKDSAFLKQEIINYKDAQGTHLQGILYYPVNFNPLKKYPMIVHIYQIQSQNSDEYYVPSDNDPLGFDLRVLLARGYFVYMPDIATKSEIGPGLSALDCVNSALDAVDKLTGIDFDKTGLIGHSFGGYETDFIATHSKRFAAYISGSGHSDIVRAYFSYNYNFNSPDYARFENGLYKTPSFKEDKELFQKNNPIQNVENVTAPILLWAGNQDENVPWNHSMEFYIGLKRNYKQVIALFYPKQGHDVGRGSKESKDLHRRMLEWWDYFLKDKKNVPWIDKQQKKDAN
jgi:dipeptidyl aminopeptidase/acylaminoacyl peptidase